MEIILDDAYVKALEAINNDHYEYDYLGLVIEDLIEDYLIRENGRLGRIKNEVYITPA